MKTKYCNNVEKIENYELAKKDNFKGWVIHHRLETHTSEGERRLVDISKEELKALGMYYHRPSEELVFMSTRDHLRLHRKGKPGPNRGKHFSEDHKRKILESKKGIKYFKGIYCIDLYDEDNNPIKEEVIKGVSMRDLFNELKSKSESGNFNIDCSDDSVFRKKFRAGRDVKLTNIDTKVVLDCSSATAFQNKFRKGRDVKLTNKDTKEVLYARIRELKNL